MNIWENLQIYKHKTENKLTPEQIANYFFMTLKMASDGAETSVFNNSQPRPNN